MIELKELTKTFNTGRVNEVLAIDSLNLSIGAGEYLVVVGANGSGKSTLLNLIAGNILPDKGKIIIEGTDVSRMMEHRRGRFVSRVFQNPLSGTAADLSIVENFRLASLRTRFKGFTIGINRKFKADVRDRIAELGMGLEDKLEQPMGSLSGGQRQALTLLMAVMDNAKVLLLDEPTAALDPRSAEIVMRTADKIVHENRLTAVLITHNMKEALIYGNRIIQMSEGRILNDRKAAEKAALQASDLYDWFI